MRAGRLYILIALITLFTSSVTSQETVDESIQVTDSLLALELLNSGISLYNNYPDSSSTLFVRSLDLALKGDYQLIEAENYYYLGRISSQSDKWETTLRFYLKAVSIFSDSGNSNRIAEIYRLIAEDYFDSGIYGLSFDYAIREFELLEEGQSKNKSGMVAARSAFLNKEFNEAIDWYNLCYRLAREDNDTTKMVESLYGLTGSKIELGKQTETRVYLDELLLLQKNRNDNRGIADVYNSLGLLDFESGKYDGAIENFQNAADYYRLSGAGLETAYSNMAICYQNKGNSKQTEGYFELALEEAGNSGNIAQKARIEHILSVLNLRKGDLYHADYYGFASIESAIESESYDILQNSYRTYSEILQEGNDFVKALDYFQEHLRLKDSLAFARRLDEQEMESTTGKMESYEQQLRINLADDELRDLAVRNLRIENEKRANELELLERDNELAKLVKEKLEQDVDLERERYSNAMQENQIMALQQQRLIQRRDSILSENEAQMLLKEKSELEAEAKWQLSELQKEQEKRRWAIWMAVSAGFTVLIILVSLISTRRKNSTLTRQKRIIEDKNLTITDSIEYASRIQNAVLPPAGFLSDWELDGFIMFRPKDIVSGDFYWGMKSGDLLCFAAADCTGHGVPGAFMSMLGTAFLNEIINSRQFENAAEILNQLRNEVITSLRQRGLEGETQDGMDIAICIYDRVKGLLHFAGANNPLYHVHDGILDRIGPDKMPIGIHVSLDKPFTNYTVKPNHGDVVYLFSDGYADQFGGSEGKKFKYKPFRDMLLEISGLPMKDQKSVVEDRFDRWKGDVEQVDDVILMGIKF